MHARKMAGGSSKPPPVTWAQRRDKVFLTINVEDGKDAKIDLDGNKLHFQAHGGPEGQSYEVTIEFFKEINPETSKYTVLSRNIPMVIMKKEGDYWPRLLKEKTKVHYLKTDFEKWRDEDDSDTEGGDDMQLEDMMKQMGNFNGGAGGPDQMNMMQQMGQMANMNGAGGLNEAEEEDSDDEELPDLE